jgi:transmembrane sensor
LEERLAALSEAVGPALSGVEGNALSEAEQPSLREIEGLALSEAEGNAARPSRHTAWLAFGALACAAAIAVVAWRTVSDHRAVALTTSAAERRTVTLSDGSRVELNARTTLLVESEGKERRVRLADGEAFFVVAKDKSRPFTVVTPAGSVRVTGTIFDVCSEAPTDFQVTVVEGSVQVTSAGGVVPQTLNAGERFDAGTSSTFGVQKLSERSIENVLAWRDGNVVFGEGASVRNALAKVARYYGYRVIVAPEAAALADLPGKIGGMHSLDNLDEFLSATETVMPALKVTHASDGIRVDLRAEAKPDSKP